MAGGPRRPGFYLGVLTTGFLAGGFLTAILRRFLPDSAARDFFTTAVHPTVGPVSVDLLVLDFTLGPRDEIGHEDAHQTQERHIEPDRPQRKV